MDFDPSKFLSQNGGKHAQTSRLIILNQPIQSFERLARIWENTSYHICADGGANFLLDLVSRRANAKQDYLPELIHGDLDSISDKVRKHYEDCGVKVSQDSSQYRTDFAKAVLVLTKGYKDTDCPDLDELGPSLEQGVAQDVIVMSTMSGRLDQALGLLHEMLRECIRHGKGSSHPVCIYFVSEQSVSFVLPVGKNTIRGLDPRKGLFKKYAGILPIYGPARLTLKGFEWDVHDWETVMGGNVSTSNHILGDEVEVEVFDQPVLFTVELARFVP
ncbi:thiamine pyrophosphokinase [Verruconis gallopava]|uniref:Thiamine pyrophosphokinase n=1 Tax=Verruconis gallopava TaxID=253628 RepID=A0A0D2A9S9_9PEZI|nr:thiamine pyrophosphokinase [Verruconis gallopava]KIW03365.1 thiamine pyrophosphokinase [Verruconis gallopava]